MKYAVIAAGEGSRLASEGIAVSKPLVRVGGECLLDRLLRIFAANDAEEVLVVCREAMTDVVNHLETISRQGIGAKHVPLRFVCRTTPSSMHSLYELSDMLAGAPFVATTVDTVFREKEFAAYVAQFSKLISSGSADGLMGVTGYIDDERPLYVSTDRELTINAFTDTDDHPKYISGGLYALTPKALTILERQVMRGEQRMRNFQRALLAEGMRLKAFVFGKVLDIDHAADIAKAEAFLMSEE